MPTDVTRDDLQPFIYFCHWSAPDAGEWYRVSQRSAYTMWYLLDGTVELRREGERWDVRAGQVAIAQPGTRARFPVRTSVYLLAFDLVPGSRNPSKDGRTYKIPGDREPQPSWDQLIGFTPPVVLESDLWGRAQDTILRLNHFYAHSRASHMRANAELATLLFTWLENQVDRSRNRIDPEDESVWLINRGEEMMMDLARRGCNVSDVAKRLGLTRGHFTTVYTKDRGISPGRYMRQVRIQEAKRLLLSKDWDLDRVAARSGFGSVRTLFARFKEEVGMTPEAWRRQEQNPS